MAREKKRGGGCSFRIDTQTQRVCTNFNVYPKVNESTTFWNVAFSEYESIALKFYGVNDNTG